jgi:hypothetical protein
MQDTFKNICLGKLIHFDDFGLLDICEQDFEKEKSDLLQIEEKYLFFIYHDNFNSISHVNGQITLNEIFYTFRVLKERLDVLNSQTCFARFFLMGQQEVLGPPITGLNFFCGSDSSTLSNSQNLSSSSSQFHYLTRADYDDVIVEKRQSLVDANSYFDSGSSQFSTIGFSRLSSVHEKKKTLSIKLFNDIYYMKIRKKTRFGDVRKSIGSWCDVDTQSISLYVHCLACEDNILIWIQLILMKMMFWFSLIPPIFLTCIMKLLIFPRK